jgi:cytochrome c-type biogenesis protein CcmH/NrfF
VIGARLPIRGAAAVIIALSLLAATTNAVAAVTPRASLTDIESDVMCVVCKTPLAVSQSPEADAERAFITKLINKGETKAQILKAMVYQYGAPVLALPPAHGFNLTVYILPPALVLLGAGLLALALPKWRRRARLRAAAPATAVPDLKPADALRLEQDLARFD